MAGSSRLVNVSCTLVHVGSDKSTQLADTCFIRMTNLQASASVQEGTRHGNLLRSCLQFPSPTFFSPKNSENCSNCMGVRHPGFNCLSTAKKEYKFVHCTVSALHSFVWVSRLLHLSWWWCSAPWTDLRHKPEEISWDTDLIQDRLLWRTCLWSFLHGSEKNANFATETKRLEAKAGVQQRPELKQKQVCHSIQAFRHIFSPVWASREVLGLYGVKARSRVTHAGSLHSITAPEVSWVPGRPAVPRRPEVTSGFHAPVPTDLTPPWKKHWGLGLPLEPASLGVCGWLYRDACLKPAPIQRCTGITAVWHYLYRLRTISFLWFHGPQQTVILLYWKFFALRRRRYSAKSCPCWWKRRQIWLNITGEPPRSSPHCIEGILAGEVRTSSHKKLILQPSVRLWYGWVSEKHFFWFWHLVRIGIT